MAKRSIVVTLVGVALHVGVFACTPSREESGPTGPRRVPISCYDEPRCVGFCGILMSIPTPQAPASVPLCECGCPNPARQSCVNNMCVGTGKLCESCNGPSDCASASCETTSGTCTAPCSSDAHCPAPATGCSSAAQYCMCTSQDAGSDATREASPGCTLTTTSDILAVNPSSGSMATGGRGAYTELAAVNLDPNKSGNTVTFNGVPAPIVAFTPDIGSMAGSVSVVVPETATTGPLVLSTCAGPSSQSITFTVGPTHAPVVTSFSPATGAGGVRVTFVGTNLTGARNCLFLGPTVTYQQPITVTSDTSASCAMTDFTPGDVLHVALDGPAGAGLGVASQTFTVQ